MSPDDVVGTTPSGRACMAWVAAHDIDKQRAMNVHHRSLVVLPPRRSRLFQRRAQAHKQVRAPRYDVGRRGTPA